MASVSKARKARSSKNLLDSVIDELNAEYGRTSTDEQVDAGTIQNQRDFLGNYRALYNLPVAGHYYDDGISGTVPLGERPEGRRLLEDARGGRFKVLLVYRLDRLGRNLKSLLDALEQLDACGVTIRSATEPFDTSTPIGRFMFQLLGGLAELERATIAERTTGGRDRVAKTGRYTGGAIPLGFDVDEAGYYVVTDRVMPVLGESETAYIADLFVRIADRKTTLNAERARLTELGVPHVARYGGKKRKVIEKYTPWSMNAMATILHNHMYKGLGILESQRGTVERPVPAIVDAATWERAQRTLTTNQQLSKRNAKHDYLLRGLVTCGHCGGTYSGTYGGTRYRCANTTRSTSTQLGGGRCPAAHVSADMLERLVWDEVKTFARNPGPAIDDAQATLRARLADTAGRSEQKRRLHDELAEKEQERQRIVALYRKGKITEAEADEQLDEIARETSSLRDLIDATQVRAEMVAAQEAYLADVGAALIVMASEIDDIDRTDDRAAKRRLIELLAPSMVLRTVVVEPVGTVVKTGPRTGEPRHRALKQVTLELLLALRSDTSKIVIASSRPTRTGYNDDSTSPFLVARSVLLAS